MLHETLNPKLFTNEKLKPSVKEKVLAIVNKFQEDIELPLKVLDIYLVGSNAAYNYTDNSDLDIHIITNFGENQEEKAILQAYYNAKKAQFNKNYNIRINGINAEIYVEDVNTAAISNGVYSVYSDSWIKKPVKQEEQKVEIDKNQLKRWLDLINDVIESASKGYEKAEDIQEIIDRLYIIRKNALIADGEYGAGNLLFKEIRNLGYLDKLKDIQKELISADLSLEEMLRKFLK